MELVLEGGGDVVWVSQLWGHECRRADPAIDLLWGGMGTKVVLTTTTSSSQESCPQSWAPESYPCSSPALVLSTALHLAWIAQQSWCCHSSAVGWHGYRGDNPPTPLPYQAVTWSHECEQDSWPCLLTSCSTQESRHCTSPEQHSMAGPGWGSMSKPVPRVWGQESWPSLS